MSSGITIRIGEHDVPVGDCAWLERKACGCYTAAVVADVPGAWTLGTEQQAVEHFNRPPGYSYEAVTMSQYRAICKRPGGWGCEQHPEK